MTRAADSFDCWCRLNRLTLNLEKSKVIVFSSITGRKYSKFKNEIEVKIGVYSMDTVNEYRYLGVILDEHLKYHSHIKMIKQQISYRMAILKRVRWLLGFKESLLLYKSSILCYFDQGDLFFNAGGKKQLQSLQVLQNRCLRIIFGKRNWPGIEQAHIRCNLLFVKDRRYLSLLKYAHLLSFNQLNLRGRNLHALRSNHKLLLKHKVTKKAFVEKSFLVKSINLWNNLPEDLKVIKNVFGFKRRVSLELLQQKLNFPE